MKFADFAPFVQPEAPGAPIFVIERAVREAAIELCQRTDVWKADPERLQIVAGVIDYDLSAPSGAEVAHILDLQRDGASLNKVGNFLELYQRLGNDTIREQPWWYTATDNAAIKVARRPKEAEELTLFLSFKPDSTATSIPDAIGREYRKTISTGAIAMLLLMNGQPWSNGQLGLLNKQLFDRQVGTIARQAKFGFSGASIRVKPRPFV